MYEIINNITSHLFDYAILLTFVYLIVGEILNLFFPIGITAAVNAMHPTQSEAYFKVFQLFLSHPTKNLPRKSSFEYKEMTKNNFETETSKNFEAIPVSPSKNDVSSQKPQKSESAEKSFNGVETSQNNACDQNDEKSDLDHAKSNQEKLNIE